ncbi:hypothetical protein SAMN02745216_05275, partial [Desulfatibacillum alkenivorans DSM 16219]
SIDANGADDARVTLTATTSITVNDNIDATGTAATATVLLDANGGAINTAADGDIKATGGTTVTVTLDAFTGGITTSGRIDANAGTNADVNLIAQNIGAIVVNDQISASGSLGFVDIDLWTNNGSIDLNANADITGIAGTDVFITLDAANGGIVSDGYISGGATGNVDIDLMARTVGSITLNNGISGGATGNVDIDLTAQNGAITTNVGGAIGGNASGNVAITLDATNGGITVGDSITGNASGSVDIDLTATTAGAIALNAALTGNGGSNVDIDLTAQSGAITTSAAGDILGSAASGSTFITLTATNGGVTTSGTITGSAIGNVDIDLDADTLGNIIVNDAIKGSSSSGNTDIDLWTDNGSIDLNAGITGAAGSNSYITLTATNGGITSDAAIAGTANAGMVDIDLYAVTGGDIVTNAGGTITGSAGTTADIDLAADNGDITVADAILGSGVKAFITLDANGGGTNDISTTGAGTLTANASGTGSAAVINILADGGRDVALGAAVAANGGETAFVNVQAAGNITSTAAGTIESLGSKFGNVTINSLAGTAGDVTLNGTVRAGSGTGGFNIQIYANSGHVTLNNTVTGFGGTTGAIDILAQNLAGTSDVNLNNLVEFTATGGTISVSAEDDVLFNNAVSDIVAAGAPVVTITADSDNSGSGSGGAITMVDGAGIDAGSGTITLLSDESITLGQLVTTNATTAAVAITVDNGALIDGGDSAYGAGTATEDIVANTTGAQVVISTVTGVGSAVVAGPADSAIETRVANLKIANTTTGHTAVAGKILIDETDGVNITGINQDATGTAAAIVTITSASGLIDVVTAGSGIDAQNGTVTLDANGGGDIAVNQTITTKAGDVNLWADNDVTFSATGDVTTNNGDVEVIADSDGDLNENGGGITMVDGTVINSSAGTITMKADEDIFLGGLVTSNNTANAVYVESFNQGIIDNGDTDIDIVATGASGWVTLRAADLIGRVVNDDVIVDPGSGSYGGRDGAGNLLVDPDPVGNAIDTQMRNLIVVTQDAGAEIAIDNTGYDLVLGTTASTVVPSAGVDASMWVRNDLDITINAWTLDGNDNVGLISTLQNVTFPDVGALGAIFNGGTGANFAFTGSRVADIAVGSGTVRLEAVNGIVKDSASGAITIQAENLILKSSSLYSEDITNIVRFATANYDYATGVDQYSPFGATNKVAFNVVAEVTNLDVEITGSGESFHFAQANDSATGSAEDLTIRDLDGDGYSMLINGHNTTPDADILVYVGNGVDINTDGVTLTVYDDLSAQNGNISLWVDSNNTQDDGGVIIGASASVTTDATADQKGALYIIGDNTIETNANVYANSGEVVVLHATANHIIIDDATVGAGTVTLDTGGNVWDIRFTQNGSLTVNGGNLNIQNADEFRMESGSAGASEITVNGGSVNIDNINIMIMQDGTTITADKNVNIGDTASLGHVHTLYMSPTSTINAGGAINAYVGGDVLLGNLNSDIDGSGGEDIHVETYQGQVPHPHFITNLTTGSLYTLSWGDEENGTIPTVGGTSAVNMPSQSGTVTVGGIINPNGNDVTLISASDAIVDG